MKKKLFATFLFLGLTLTAFGQSMSDTQILQYVMQQKKLGKAESDIATELLKKGATLEQIQNMRKKYAKQLEQHSMAGEADKAIDAASRMRENNAPDQVDQQKFQQQVMQNVPDNMLYGEQTGQPATGVEEAFGKKVFGRDIFNNKKLTFEPVMNIATPQNYVLGPGDQLIIDVYGDTQRSEQLTVSPDGDVNVPDYGPVHVAGLSVSAAQNKVRSHLGTYYESSDIKVTVGQTRTILVNVMGEVKAPGTYTLSAFATVFHALYMAGGISDLGTLRNIKVYRQGRLISVVDV